MPELAYLLPAARRRAARPAPPAPWAPEPPTAHQRARRAGGPQDRARYDCACGASFVADVVVNVRCPHCAGEQAW